MIKEDWSSYKLEDDTILKLKRVLIKVIGAKETDKIGKPVHHVQTYNVMGILVPDNLMGTPTKREYTLKELFDSIVADDMKFEIIKESWDEYRLKDGSTLEIKPTLVKVSRTDKFDERGEPIYLVNSEPLIKEK